MGTGRDRLVKETGLEGGRDRGGRRYRVCLSQRQNFRPAGCSVRLCTVHSVRYLFIPYDCVRYILFGTSLFRTIVCSTFCSVQICSVLLCTVHFVRYNLFGTGLVHIVCSVQNFRAKYRTFGSVR